MTTETTYENGLIIGKFRFFHPGHLRLIDEACKRCKQVRILICSSQLKNPFTAVERYNIIKRSLYINDIRNYSMLCVDDIYCEDAWPYYINGRSGMRNDKDKAFFISRKDIIERESYLDKMIELGYTNVVIEQHPFFMLLDHKYEKFESSSDILTHFMVEGFSERKIRKMLLYPWHKKLIKRLEEHRWRK